MKLKTHLIALAALTLGIAATPTAFAAGNHDPSPKHGGAGRQAGSDHRALQ